MQLSLAYLINLEILLSYELPIPKPKVASFLSFCNSFNSTTYLNEN